MAEPRWQRYAPLGAVGFLLSLGLGAAVIGASSPAGDASATEIATYFADHQGGLLANTLLSAFGGFVLFPGSLPVCINGSAASRVPTACVHPQCLSEASAFSVRC